jgi:hypothetical protein
MSKEKVPLNLYLFSSPILTSSFLPSPSFSHLIRFSPPSTLHLHVISQIDSIVNLLESLGLLDRRKDGEDSVEVV